MNIKQLLFSLTFLLFVGHSKAATIVVTTNLNTQTQVDNASPGDTLLFETGIHGEIDLNDIINTECDPMVLMSQDPLNPATIYRSTISSGEALAIRRSEYIIVENLIMDGGMFGTWIEACKHIIFRDNEIKNPGQEGLHVWNKSTYVDIVNNVIHHTGNYNSKWGEGIYVGTGSYSPKPFPDSTNYIWIEDNELYNCGNGEAINIKGECFHVTARNNHIHDITPGTPDQYNQAAITASDVGSNSTNNDFFVTTPRDIWIENNLVENVSLGLNAHGIMSMGNGVYILNNTVTNCEEEAIYLNAYADMGMFVYVYGNIIDNEAGGDYKFADLADIRTEDPGITNPNEAQKWCGDVKNSCAVPNLGENTSLCGVGSIQLDANISNLTNKTFSWYKNNVLLDDNLSTLAVSTAGEYKLIVDSLGLCSNSSIITISDEIEEVNFGDDFEWCDQETYDLYAGTYNPLYTYTWSLDGKELSETSNVLTLSKPGIYTVTVAANGCMSKTDEIEILSNKVPTVTGDTICEAGIVNLEASGNGDLTWYSAKTAGDLLATGTNYNPTISENTTYYVEQNTEVSYTVGRTEMNNSWDATTFDRKIKFTIEQSITIDSVTVISKSNQEVHVRILASDNSSIVADISNTVGIGTFEIPVKVTLAPGTYYMDAEGTTGTLKYENESAVPTVDHASYGVAGIISFDAEPDFEADIYPRWRYFYSWKIKTGGSCTRVPVNAIIDAMHTSCDETVTSIFDANESESTSIKAYPNPTSNEVYLSEETAFEVMNMFGQIILKGSANTFDLSNYPSGIYFIKTKKGVIRINKE